VVGGSADNKVGGAGGKALVASGALMDRYFAMLKQKVRDAIDKPPGVSDDLTVTVVVHISASGRLSGAHVVKSSGNEEFDRAVIAAFSHVSMPEHPEHKNEDLELEFRTKDED
jgi:colicin import membrane protein